MSRVTLIFAAALLALMSGALFYAARLPVETTAPAPQPQALEVVTHPAFSLPDLEGTSRELAEWDGSHRLLNFWATWCAPCRREIPLLKAFQDAHGDQYQVIGIAVDFVEPVQAYAEAITFNYPVLIGQEDAMAVAESSGVEFIGMPFTMIVTADGELLTAHIGEIHQEDLDQIVEVIEQLDGDVIDRDTAREALQTL